MKTDCVNTDCIKISIENIHNRIRSILIDYGNQEFGDCIIDEICKIFNFPSTIDIKPKEKN